MKYIYIYNKNMTKHCVINLNVGYTLNFKYSRDCTYILSKTIFIYSICICTDINSSKAVAEELLLSLHKIPQFHRIGHAIVKQSFPNSTFFRFRNSEITQFYSSLLSIVNTQKQLFLIINTIAL